MFGNRAKCNHSQESCSTLVPVTQAVLVTNPLESDMSRIVNDKSYRDIVIKTNDQDIYAHCIILKARTRIPLQNLKRTSNNVRQYDCSKFTSEDILLVLRYIYTGSVSLMPSQCFRAAKIARKLYCHRLYEELEPKLTREQRSYFESSGKSEDELSEVPGTDLEEESVSET